MKHYIYYWYHHMMPDDERNYIQSVLNNHDYEKFIELYKEYGKQALDYGHYSEEFETWYPMTFLPDYISIYDDKDEERIDEAYILDKEAFMKIEYSECECG